jgi:putative DNA primase/helicase
MNDKLTSGSCKDLEPDIDEAVLFLKQLDEDAGSWRFQVFFDGDGKEPDEFSAHHWQDTLQNSVKKLVRLNHLGAGIYLAVNRIADCDSRTKEDVKEIRAVHTDLDGVPLKPVYTVELEPHIIVETSPGHYQAYWFVEPGLDHPHEYEAIQGEVAHRLDGDDVKGPERVVRLPGFYNRKDLKDDPRLDEPFQIRIHESNPAKRYTPDEVRDAFKPEPKAKKLHSSNGHANDKLTEGFTLPEEIEKGERNNILTQYAGSIWTEETTHEELLSKLKKANQEHCTEPLPESEIESIVDSADRNFDPVPEPGDSDFSPTQFAKQVIRKERARGVIYARVVEQGTFYRYSAESGVWIKEDPEYIKGLLRTAGLEKRHVVNEVFEAFKHVVRDRKHDIRFDPGKSPDTDSINFENCVLDWRTGERKEHDPTRYDLVQIPHEYDPEAECPKWREALDEWINEPETRQFIQEFIGYCLIPDASLDRYVILTGTGKNGKSTFLEVVQEMFGRENCTGIPLHKLTNKPRFETKNIMGTLVNICSDIDAEYIERTGTLKKIVSGEQIRGEFKHGDSFDFTPFARLIFSANELPKARDKSEAWYRRMEVVPFPNRFDPDAPDTDPNLSEKLINEIPGVINWALEGLRRLEERGHFVTSDEMSDYMDDYQRKNDSVLAFVDDRLEITADADDRVPLKAIHRLYKSYCEDSGLSPVSRDKLGDRLKNELSLNCGRPWEQYCDECDRWNCDDSNCPGTLEKKQRTTYYGVRIND